MAKIAGKETRGNKHTYENYDMKIKTDLIFFNENSCTCFHRCNVYCWHMILTHMAIKYI